MSDKTGFDYFRESDDRIEQLKEMARRLNTDGEPPTMEQIKKVQALAEEAQQERPKPTKADKEQMLEDLRRKYGDLPREKLIRKEVTARLKDVRSFSQEMSRAEKQKLSEAILVGDAALARRRIAEGADVNQPSGAGYSVLMLAGLQKQSEIVQILLDAGADIGLPEAAMLGDREALRRLLDGGAEIDARNKHNGFTALHWAAGQGKNEAARLLLERGANIDEAGDKGFTPLLQAALQENSDLVALLRAHGAHFGIVEAALLGDCALLLRLLEEGADIRSENAAGMDPLMAASACGHIDAMQILLDRGADPHRVNARQLTALTWAISKNRYAAVYLLLDNGVDVNAPGYEANEYIRGRTPISHAILYKSPQMMRVLIERGADVTVRDASGQTPLHWASAHCDPEVMRVLLDAGAEVDAPGRGGYTPLMRVLDNSLMKLEPVAACVRLLLERGADVNARAEHRETPLMRAAARGHSELVNILLAAGAEIDATDEHGSTALATAARENHPEVVALLKGYGAKIKAFPDLLEALLFGRNAVLKTLLMPRFWKRKLPQP